MLALLRLDVELQLEIDPGVELELLIHNSFDFELELEVRKSFWTYDFLFVRPNLFCTSRFLFSYVQKICSYVQLNCFFPTYSFEFSFRTSGI